VTVTVGAGGNGGTGAGGAVAGGNSVFGALTAIGGGRGGTGPATGGVYATAGGSGGGGYHNPSDSGKAGTAGQGNAGGTGYDSTNTAVGFKAGGGGGAGGAGTTATPTANGTGGAGLQNSISGAATFYAGGGGGGIQVYTGTTLGGSGVGGNGGANGSAGTAGTASRGAGGGGGSQNIATSATGNGGNGGSGIVIVRYALPGRFAVANGNWSSINTWSAGGCAGSAPATVPAAGDDVTICATRTVSLDTNTANLASLTIQGGGVLNIGNSNTARTLTVSGSITNAGTLQVPTNSNTTHTMNAGGDIANSGTLNLSTDGNSRCNVTFNGSGTQAVSGAGATTRFNRVFLNMAGATVNNVVDVTATNFTLVSGGGNGINFTDGTFRLSAGVSINTGTAAFTIPANSRLWINHAGATYRHDSTITLNAGTLQIDSGTVNVGNAANENLLLQSNAASTFLMNGGALNVAGRVTSNATNGQGSFTLASGTITVGISGNNATNNALSAPFFIASNTSFTQSGGTIVIQSANTADGNAREYDVNSTTSSVTGGTLQIGNGSTAGSSTFQIESVPPVWNIVVNGTGTPTAALFADLTVLNDLTINTGGTLNANNQDITIAGNWTTDGTYTPGNGVVTFNGAVAQTLGGTASGTSFSNLTMSNSAAFANRKLAISHDITVSTLLTFNAGASTGGRIVTGTTAKVILPTGSNITNASGSATESDFVAGRLQRFVAAGASTVVFPVGSDGAALPAAGYSPASLQFTANSGAGSLIVSVGTPLGDHPNIGTSGLNATKSVNRWWSMTTTGVSGAAVGTVTFNPTFTFIGGAAPAGDLDNNAVNTANLEIERWNGATWSITTAGARNPASITATGVNALGEFAIAEKAPVVSPPDSFNAVEAGAAVTGRLFTKIRGTGFVLDIVAIQGGVQQMTFNEAVTVDLVTGGLGGANCGGGALTTVAGPADVTLASGRVTTPSASLATAYPNVRVRIRYPVGGPYTITTCSSDNFSIRPQAFSSVTAPVLTNSGMSGDPKAKAGDSFTLDAVAGAGYNGTPVINNSLITAHAGAIQAGTLSGTFSVANPLGGTATGAAFTYSEVGNFRIDVNGIYDSSFTTTADLAGTDCTVGFSNAPDGSGRYGCSFGNNAQTAAIGRFTPDHFDVSLTAPRIATACAAGGFTYVGQRFDYTVQPVITVTAKNSAGLGNLTTQNYQGSWWKITSGSLTGKAYAVLAGSIDTTSAPGTDPVIRYNGDGGGAGEPAAGEGTLTFGSGTGFFFTRTTPLAEFDAEISLAINVIDGDTIAYASNPARFGDATAGNGIAFNNGKPMRFGRLRMQNVSGSQLVPLQVLAEVQYWSGSSFITHTADSCTSVAAANIAMGSYAGSLTDSPKCLTAVSGGGMLSAGRRTFLLAAPGTGVSGSVTLATNLAAVPNGNTCAAIGGAPSAAITPNQPFLQTGPAFNQNPTARATFGVRGGSNEVVYIRENY
jgi:hypothetical protein